VSLSSREIKEILAILEDSGWDEAEVSIGDVTLAVSKGHSPPGGRPAAAAPAAQPTAGNASQPPPGDAGQPSPPPPAARGDGHAGAGAPAGAGPDASANGHLISSPSVGVFWAAPEPGAPPFVEEGSQVEAGQPLCIVEIMKLMQQVIADVPGVVSAIHIQNGEQVEFGTPLFSIAPASA
jgi:acetyl-CoA carboxylase biotin carboxyl carrier protein